MKKILQSNSNKIWKIVFESVFTKKNRFFLEEKTCKGSTLITRNTDLILHDKSSAQIYALKLYHVKATNLL